MRIQRMLAVCGLLFAGLPALAANPAEKSDDSVVAEVSGVALTSNDLATKESGSLLQAQYQYYLTERKAVDHLVETQLIELQARKKGVTTEQLLDKEVYKNIKDPTEDQLQVYYEGVESDQPYSIVKEQIIEHLRELRRKKARAEYVKNLRTDANVRILLPPPVASVDTQDANVVGPANAPLTLVEFADYECPYCERVVPDLQKIKQEYGSNLRIVYKDFPLPMHKKAEKAAEAARCAGDQGKFAEYHDVLFYSRQLDVTSLKKHAGVLKLDQTKFDKCLDTGAEAAAVNKDLEEGKKLGLTGTPSFFANGHFFSGAVEYSTLREILGIEMRPPVVAASSTTASPATVAQTATSSK